MILREDFRPIKTPIICIVPMHYSECIIQECILSSRPRYIISNLLVLIPHPFLFYCVHARTNLEMCTSCFHNLELPILITENSQKLKQKIEKCKNMMSVC